MRWLIYRARKRAPLYYVIGVPSPSHVEKQWKRMEEEVYKDLRTFGYPSKVTPIKPISQATIPLRQETVSYLRMATRTLKTDVSRFFWKRAEKLKKTQEVEMIRRILKEAKRDKDYFLKNPERARELAELVHKVTSTLAAIWLRETP